MERGDVLFWKGDGGPIDRAIVGASLSPYVHCAIALDDYYYCEAVWPRVRLSTLGVSRPATIARPLYIDAAQALRACDAAILLIGNQYDALGVTAFGVGLAFPSWRDRITDTFNDADAVLKLHAMFCSRVVASALIAAGIAVPGGDHVSPGELAAFLGVTDAHI